MSHRRLVAKDFKASALVALSLASLAALALGGFVLLGGGFRSAILGISVRATDPIRPVVLALILASARWLAGRGHGLAPETSFLHWMSQAHVTAACLAVLTTVVGLTTNYGVAGGADSFGYISQADLWIAGHITVSQEWLRDAPWMHALWTGAPLGYRPAAAGIAIAPLYPPGLPLLMAGAKLVVGQCGVAWIAPIAGGVLVLATYAIGKRLASPALGAAAAWIAATSPVLLYMIAAPMSDAPAGAFTALAIYGCVRCTVGGAAAAGASMAAVILIRPNLAPLAPLFALWMLADDRHSPTWRGRLSRAALLLVCALPGPLLMAAFNRIVTGSAAQSSYGNLEGFFALDHILPNVRIYGMALLRSHTPLAALALLALVIPARWLKKRRALRSTGLLLLVALGVTALYLPFLVLDAWWYLRFFLPAAPALAVGVAWLCTNTTGLSYGRVGLVVLMFVGGWGINFARTHDAFVLGWGGLRHVSAAHAVEEMTEPDSVILSMHHSGSVRFYGARRSLRYDWMESGDLDKAVEWLRAKGMHPYILLDDWEIDGFRKRFPASPYGRLSDDTLVFQQNVGTRVFLFDTRSHVGEMVRSIDAFLPSAVRCCQPRKRAME